MRGKREIKRKRRLSRQIRNGAISAFALMFVVAAYYMVSAKDYNPTWLEESEMASVLFIPPASSSSSEQILFGQRLLFSDKPEIDVVEEVEIPEDALPIASILINQYDVMLGTQAVRVSNTSDENPNFEEIQAASPSIAYSGEGPQVLIVHTHGTESYAEENSVFYYKSDDARSTDTSKNIVAVGNVLSSELEMDGIEVLHIETLCDEESYNDAYTVSRELIQEALEEYPSIRIVIDMHRDSLITNSGVKYRPVTNIYGKDAAQMMFVVGTGSSKIPHDDWAENLALVFDLQEELNSRYENIMRPIVLREGTYNQDLSAGTILIEMGTCANSLEEAIYSAKIFANVLTSTLKSAT